MELHGEPPGFDHRIGMLFEVRPWDPAVLTTILAVLAAGSIAASWVPARRAARVDPAVVLRQE